MASHDSSRLLKKIIAQAAMILMMWCRKLKASWWFLLPKLISKHSTTKPCYFFCVTRISVAHICCYCYFCNCNKISFINLASYILINPTHYAFSLVHENRSEHGSWMRVTFRDFVLGLCCEIDCTGQILEGSIKLWQTTFETADYLWSSENWTKWKLMQLNFKDSSWHFLCPTSRYSTNIKPPYKLRILHLKT